MKHCSNFLLVFTLFFYFAAGYNISGDRIWNQRNPYPKDVKHHTDGCPANMRLFGPNNQYRCNCKDLQDCDFAKNGKCKDKCNTDFEGPFCQRILYHNYLVNYKPNEKELFPDGKKIYKAHFISFDNTYRINFIKMNCQTPDPQQTVTLSIGNNEFCKKICLQNITCTGDESGRYLNIVITGNNQTAFLSNMKISGCSPYWFGKQCDKQCHCANNQDCHKFTGNCPNGCEKGRSGPDCQKLNYENVAKNKPASQNSIYSKSILLENNTCENVEFQFSAHLAVDGNIDQQHERRSCMHTIKGFSKWSVYLGKKYNISQIRIYNRNTRMWHINRANIDVDGQTCYQIMVAKKIYDIKCKTVIAGENITIKQDQALNFCEVEVLQCLPGFYSDRCSKKCSNCKKTSCDQWTGRCVSGCAPGYWQNDNKPCTACSPGKFGENCAKTCHCKDNTNCPKETGICEYGRCETGYQGETCQEPCSDGYFGEQCLQICHCKDNTNCNKINGTCGCGGCEAGYKGNNCQESKPNIFIPINICLSVLLVIISGIAIYFKIKSKKKEDKTSASGPNVSLAENVEMNFVKDNDDVETSTYEVIKDNDDEEENPEPLKEQESIHINPGSVETSTYEVIKDNDDKEENPEPLKEQESIYINPGSVETSTYEVIKDNDDEVKDPKQESIYTELF